MKLKNAQMDAMIQSLRPHLGRRDVIGYAAARNTRVLTDAACEYLMRKDEVVREHGIAEMDADGNPTGRFVMDVAGNEDAMRELEEWGAIEHEADLFTLKYDEAIGKLSGQELLSIDWMFED